MTAHYTPVFLGHLPTQVVPHLLNLVLLKSHGFAGYQREAGRQAGSGGAQCRLERTCGSVVSVFQPSLHLQKARLNVPIACISSCATLDKPPS